MMMRTLIMYRGIDLYEIAAELKRAGFGQLMFLQRLPDEFSPTGDFTSEWCAALDGETSLGKDERQLLEDTGRSLGSGDTESQVMLLDSAIERIRQIGQMREKEYSEKGKLYRSLGTICGIAVGMIVI